MGCFHFFFSLIKQTCLYVKWHIRGLSGAEPFPPPPSEVTKWVGCCLLASFFFPRTMLYFILFVLLPNSALAKHHYIFLSSHWFRLLRSHVTPACWNLLCNLRMGGWGPLPFVPFRFGLNPTCSLQSGCLIQVFRHVRPSDRISWPWSSSSLLSLNFHDLFSSLSWLMIVAHFQWLILLWKFKWSN